MVVVFFVFLPKNSSFLQQTTIGITVLICAIKTPLNRRHFALWLDSDRRGPIKSQFFDWFLKFSSTHSIVRARWESSAHNGANWASSSSARSRSRAPVIVEETHTATTNKEGVRGIRRRRGCVNRCPDAASKGSPWLLAPSGTDKLVGTE